MDEYINIVQQLPEETVITLFKEFVFSDFLKGFASKFEFPKQSKELDRFYIKHSRFTWTDKCYADFMMSLLFVLEPRREEKETIILDELDEIHEVIFLV